MNIVYATDDKGALGTGVSIVSLMENLPADVHADIYIMTDGLNEDNTARLNSLQRSYRLSLHFIDMKDKYKDFPVGSKWSAATYYRLGLAGELPATVERALYVDIDTIFNRDISSMYETEFGDCLIARQKVKDICDKYGFDIDPDMKIYDMSVSQKQTVEIVKVLYRGADILILDEPTAVLTPQETDKLFAVMRNMKADGKSLIIITHKLHEVLDVSDRVAVLRKGEYIGDVLTKDADQQSLTDMMVGHSVSLNINRPTPVNVEPRLKIEGLTVFDELGVKRLDDRVGVRRI